MMPVALFLVGFSFGAVVGVISMAVAFAITRAERENP